MQRMTIKDANEKFNAGNYLDACAIYFKFIIKAQQTRFVDPISVYARIGVLQCQIALAYIPQTKIFDKLNILTKLVNEMRELQTKKVCERVLQKIRAGLSHPIAKADYSLRAADNFRQAFLQKGETLKNFLNVTKLRLKKDDKIQYIASFIAGLEQAIDTYRLYNVTDNVTEVKVLLAKLFEDYGDEYVDLLEKHENQVAFGNGSKDPLPLLIKALQFYEEAIMHWRELDDSPSLDLLLSILHIGYLASEFLTPGRYNQYFDMEKLITKHSMTVEFASCEDAGKQGQFDAYLVSIQELKSKVFGEEVPVESEQPEVKQPQNSLKRSGDVLGERATKQARLSTSHTSIFVAQKVDEPSELPIPGSRR